MAAYKVAPAFSEPSGPTAKDRLDYQFSCATLGLEPEPYSIARHFHILGLIHWRHLSPQMRGALYEQWLAGENWKTTRPANKIDPIHSGPNKQDRWRSDSGLSQRTCWNLIQNCNSAYGGSWGEPIISPRTVARPWALNAAEFLYCYRELRDGHKEDPPDLEKQNRYKSAIVDGAQDTAWEYAKEFMVEVAKKGLITAGTVGAYVIRLTAITPVGFLIAVGADAAKNLVIKSVKETQMENLRHAYEIDRQRRGPDCVVPS